MSSASTAAVPPAACSDSAPRTPRRSGPRLPVRKTALSRVRGDRSSGPTPSSVCRSMQARRRWSDLLARPPWDPSPSRACWDRRRRRIRRIPHPKAPQMICSRVGGAVCSAPCSVPSFLTTRTNPSDTACSSASSDRRGLALPACLRTLACAVSPLRQGGRCRGFGSCRLGC